MTQFLCDLCRWHGVELRTYTRRIGTEEIQRPLLSPGVMWGMAKDDLDLKLSFEKIPSGAPPPREWSIDPMRAMVIDEDKSRFYGVTVWSETPLAVPCSSQVTITLPPPPGGRNPCLEIGLPTEESKRLSDEFTRDMAAFVKTQHAKLNELPGEWQLVRESVGPMRVSLPSWYVKGEPASEVREGIEYQVWFNLKNKVIFPADAIVTVQSNEGIGLDRLWDDQNVVDYWSLPIGTEEIRAEEDARVFEGIAPEEKIVLNDNGWARDVVVSKIVPKNMLTAMGGSRVYPKLIDLPENPTIMWSVDAPMVDTRPSIGDTVLSKTVEALFDFDKYNGFKKK